ncbi:MAG: type II toxin-antitoxin system HicB family antitoxin [Deltaproteobacteria bacterium]|nr:MAG: type II toxin-antitoxin system HicB family antitoxin [Deltaproteobacteria bacterium]
MINYTAKYTKNDSGYTGELLEWPEVITEGRNLEECRMMLRDALNEMILAYHELGRPLPVPNSLIEQLSVEERYVCQTA